MGKYKYDKTVLKDLSVKPFLNQVSEREKMIENAEAKDIEYEFNSNKLAKSFHPPFIAIKVKKIIEINDDVKEFVLKPNKSYGFKSLPYFKAGQYIAVSFKIGQSFVSRPYTISSNPALALGEEKNEYRIVVKRKEGGFVSNYLLDNGFVHMEFLISAPLGDFYYNQIRDSKNIIAIAGGSGITPFISMASAISTGIEDFNLTILYGSKSKKDIFYKDKLKEIEKCTNGKVKVIHILSEEKENKKDKKVSKEKKSKGKEFTIGELDSAYDDGNYEYGFITSKIIKKYINDKDFSVFVSGPQKMNDFVKGELKKIQVSKRKIRFSVNGELGDVENEQGYPKEIKGKENDEYKLTLIMRGEKYNIPCFRKETLIQAIERAGIQVTTDCRSGECGWCRSRLLKGNVFILENKDKRRQADKKFGWIHPCITYPLGNIMMEVFPNA